MGQQISSVFSSLGRFFEYPVKRKPICFNRQEDFTATGETIKRQSEAHKAPTSDYEALVELFYKRLEEQRQFCQEMKERDRRWSIEQVVRRFPGWSELTVANLHSLFLLFDNQSNGMLGFDDFCAVLESLGEGSSMERRKRKFTTADQDADGWITYDEFLALVYNFDTMQNGELTGLAKLCNEVADNIQFISNLSVGEQLEYGLF
ncbi:uncharacterized protein LOC121737164 [Aricia agestis]|uniref:uncharacterized protein LOC121737164 n=1 Tax=Aricia agestis TaxID=91739 RepID=UPI001C2051B1|nr:uncharacterized protein LOC121737164 [Aricia agestis]